MPQLRVDLAMTDVFTPRNPLRTAPNLLTVMRICLAPFLVAAILESKFGLSFVLFVAAGLTDALDGVLARVLKQRTALGQYLDPVARPHHPYRKIRRALLMRGQMDHLSPYGGGLREPGGYTGAVAGEALRHGAPQHPRVP